MVLLCRATLPATTFALALLAGGCASNPVLAPQSLPSQSYASPRTHTTPAPPQTNSSLNPVPVIEVKTAAPEHYVVKQGDTLWDIASHFLKEPWYWPEIWHVNPHIANPHRIYPGDVLTLYYVGGRPYIEVGGGPRVSDSTIRLSPRVRVEVLEQNHTSLPIQAIQQFITRPRVVSKEELDSAPYILSAQDDHLIYGSGDRVYVRGLVPLAAGRHYSVFRPGEILVDPVTHESLGYQAILVADATVLKTGDPSTVILENNEREALAGDRLLPLDDDEDRAFLPRAPAHEIDGVIISLFDAISQIGQHQVAVLNVGARNRIEKGHVLAVYQAGRMVRDPYAREGQSKSVVLPAEKAGVMMVFRTFEKVSYALVMDATRPIHVGDAVRSPE